MRMQWVLASLEARGFQVRSVLSGSGWSILNTRQHCTLCNVLRHCFTIFLPRGVRMWCYGPSLSVLRALLCSAALLLTRARVPLDWAQTQSNLGAALRALGERERRRPRS
jgi:hypothetical protein